ncbi:hypothetical protein DEO72_LG6g1244 [Vigna unguiculata]|uniref:Uncharacterized protein n=1 Tax=Vigna unguiculata TaxID=3917 RepID=A0A4D6M7J0_VIGUN|nr:hypothetical protein DEO72_LG6g1244 [Vigna unguiculata]
MAKQICSGSRCRDKSGSLLEARNSGCVFRCSDVCVIHGYYAWWWMMQVDMNGDSPARRVSRWWSNGCQRRM